MMAKQTAEVDREVALPPAFYLATGGAGYSNAKDSAVGWYPIEGGVSLHFDVLPARDEAE